MKKPRKQNRKTFTQPRIHEYGDLRPLTQVTSIYDFG